MSTRTKTWLVYSAVLLSSLLLFMDVLLEVRPTQNDHANHYVKMWILKQAWLETGSLWTWTDAINFGYPTLQTYPFLPDLLTLAIDRLSFGLWSFETSYTLAFVGLLTLTSLFVTAFAKRLTQSLAIALATGLALQWFDHGGFDEGGWTFYAQWGVWYGSVAAGFFLYSLSLFLKAHDERSVPTLAFSALWLGLALLCHPLALILVGLFLPAVLFVFWIEGRFEVRSIFRQVSFWLLPAFLLAGPFLIPFFSSADLIERYKFYWKPMQALGRDLVTSGMFGNFPEPLWYAGLLGIALAIALKQTRILLLVLVFGIGLVLLNWDTQHFLIENGMPWLAGINTRRPIVAVKMCFLILSLWSIPTAVHLLDLKRRFLLCWQDSRVRLALCGVVVLLLPVLFHSASTLWKTYVLSKSVQTVHTNPYQGAKLILAEKLKPILEKDPRPFKIATYSGSMQDRLEDFGELLDAPTVVLEYIPGTLFKNFQIRSRASNEEVLQLLNVRYIVSDTPLDEFYLEEVFKMGPLAIYEYAHWSSDQVRIKGASGRVDGFSRTATRVSFQLRETTQMGTLVLPIGYSPEWHCQFNGNPIPVDRYKLSGETLVEILSLPAYDGRYQCEYVAGRAVAIGKLCFLLGVIMIASMVFLQRLLPRKNPHYDSEEPNAEFWRKSA